VAATIAPWLHPASHRVSVAFTMAAAVSWLLLPSHAWMAVGEQEKGQKKIIFKRNARREMLF
jgi:hypothetical protein